jgi:hypothetical protein
MLTESPGLASSAVVDDRQSYSPGYFGLLILFSVETLAINLARLPESMRFDRYAFCDHGANLTLQYLIAQGLRPSLDFGYHYGLLPALIGRVWFGLFGATPWSYQAAMVVADLLCAWAITRILWQLKVGGTGLALAVITLGYAFQATYVNFAHATEAVLLSHALAEQARGARSRALALAAAAVFAKPSMGWVYGLLLVILIARDMSRSGFNFSRFLRALSPGAMVFLGLAATLSLVYGAPAFFHTVFPIEGVSNYRALNFGLMAAGRGLWDPEGYPWIIYIIDASGYLVVSTVFLCASALLLLRSNCAGRLTARRCELVVSCAILHVAFLALFFGNRWSWVYYSYVLMIGTSVAVSFGRLQHRIGLAFCVLAVFSWTDIAYWSYRWARTTGPAPTTAGLWAPADEAREWTQVQSMAVGRKTVVFDTMGAAELLFSGFERPVSLYLTRGLMLPTDIRRKLDLLSSAQMAIVPNIPIVTCSGIPDAPGFKEAIKDYQLAWSGKYFDVYRRAGTP